MNFLGISVAKDLASVVVFEGSDCPTHFHGHPLEWRIFTQADGRAFRGCPYWKSWQSDKSIITHDDELDFARALHDVVDKWGVSAIGYDPAELTLGGDLGVALPSDHPSLPSMVGLLNDRKRSYDNLFPEGSVMEYMWRSLPENPHDIIHSRRMLPTASHPASGRIDGILALMRAMIVAGEIAYEVEQEEEETAARLSGLQLHGDLQQNEKVSMLAGLTENTIVKIRHRFGVVKEVDPYEACTKILSGEWTFKEVISRG